MVASFCGGVQGIARQRQAIIGGLRESVVTFGSEVDDVKSRDVIEAGPSLCLCLSLFHSLLT